jgi:hypothetical protein
MYHQIYKLNESSISAVVRLIRHILGADHGEINLDNQAIKAPVKTIEKSSCVDDVQNNARVDASVISEAGSITFSLAEDLNFIPHAQPDSDKSGDVINRSSHTNLSSVKNNLTTALDEVGTFALPKVSSP